MSVPIRKLTMLTSPFLLLLLLLAPPLAFPGASLEGEGDPGGGGGDVGEGESFWQHHLFLDAEGAFRLSWRPEEEEIHFRIQVKWGRFGWRWQ